MKKYLILISALLLVACKAPQPLKGKEMTQADQAAVDTAQAAVSISHSLSELGLAQRNEQGMLKRESEAGELPQVLSRLVSIDWAGPVEPLIKQLAEGTQLRVKVIGIEPAIPVTVALHQRDTSVYHILQNLRGQIGNRAEILVYPSSGVIELHYF